MTVTLLTVMDALGSARLKRITPACQVGTDREGPSICKITCIQGWNYYEPNSAFKAYKECDDGNLIEDDGCSS